MSAEARYWAQHPALGLLADAGGGGARTASGLRLTRTHGTCMWPGLREGDLVFYADVPDGPLADLVGRIAIARAHGEPVAHRILRVLGEPGAERLVLGGDLSEPDRLRPRRDILGIARAVYRPGHGFVDLPERLVVGPLGRAILGRMARFFTWAERRARGG